MMGDMNSPEKTAKMIHPMLNIKCEIFENEEKKPVQERIKRKIRKMKPEYWNKDNNINSPEKEVYDAIKNT